MVIAIEGSVAGTGETIRQRLGGMLLVRGKDSYHARSPFRRRGAPTMTTSPPTERAVTPSPAADAGSAIAVHLAEHARQARGAFADETVRALRNDVQKFTAWCADHGAEPMPATPDTVAAFVDAMAEIRAPASVRRYVASVASVHRAAGVADPSKTEVVRLALKRMARAKGTRQRQAAPIGELDVERILATAGTGLADLRNVGLLLAMRDLLARRGEAVAIEREHVAFAADGSATVLIARSKTDQEGQGEVRWLAPRTATALRRWLEVAGIEDGPVFRSINKAGAVGRPLTPGEVPRILKRLTARAGIDPAGISGHSCRVGMAQDLTAHGAELPDLMVAGRWASPAMPARYAARIAAGRGAVARYYERRGVR